MHIKTNFAVKETNRTFDERVAEWREFLKMDSNEAVKYYNENVFPDVIKKCAENTANNGNAADILKPDYMILTVGTSFEPLVLSISTIQPQKEILFLYTDESRKFMAKVIDFLELSAEHYKTEEVERASTVIIDRTVKEQYEKWKKYHENNKNGGNGKVVIDFTGGTKAMSGGGAMSALLIDAKLVYVDSTYDNDLRKPFPGSEYVNLIKNPYEVSGAIDYEKAVKLFEEGDYKGTLNILKNVLNSTRGREYEKYNLLKQLSHVYSYWEDIDFKTALSNIENLINNIEAFKNSESEVNFLRDKIPQLIRHKEVLESLKKIYGELAAAQNIDTHNTGKDIFEILKIPGNSNNIGNLLFFVFTEAQRNAKRGDYNTAVLLLYRMTELISNRRLALRGINAFSDPVTSDYTGKVEQALIETYSNPRIRAKVDLTAQMTQYAYLKVLRDNIFNSLDDETSDYVAKLRELYENNKKRNGSFYIHGFKKMDEKDYNSAEAVSKKWLRRFCKTENINFEEILKSHTFLTPDDLN